MKKYVSLFLAFLIVVVMSLGSFLIYKNKTNNKDMLDELINISKLDDKFLDKYYNDMDKLRESGNDENVLIIVSKNKPKDTYGAKNIIDAPNSTYIFEYKNEIDRDEAKKKLEKDKTIISVTENRKYEMLENNNQNNSSNYNSWGIEKSGLDHAIDYVNQNGGKNVNVAIIDSGCDMDLFNASYNGRIEETYNLFDVGTYGHNSMYDHAGHGTHIAGTIAEGTPSNVKIIPFKVGDRDNLDSLDILESITYITENHKADVINMSFGAFVSKIEIDAEYVVIEAAKRENIICVAAAGNSASETLEVPSAYDNTLSISAVDSNLDIAIFSSFNDYVTFAAPGEDILSINGVKSGTSMATPHAVCAVAFLKTIKKDLSFEGVINALKQNVQDLGAVGKDKYFGYGFIDLSTFKLCTDNNLDSCTILDENYSFVPTNIELEEVVLTPYNYGSITNILPTKVKLTDESNNIKITTIDKLEDIVVTGYDPYASGEQIVNLKYLDFNLSFNVTNPDNYEIGWIYQHGYDNQGNLKESYSISGYKDNNLQLEKLYFPEKIEGIDVDAIQYLNQNYQYVFGDSLDAKYYKEVYLPSNFKEVGATSFRKLTNLYKVKSYADELIVESAFQGLKYLTILDANVLLNYNSSYAFEGDVSLKSITLSSNTTLIPTSTFDGCIFLSSINLPEGLVEIGENAFSKTSIKNIVLPNSLQKIGSNAFSDSLIKSVTIPASVTEIGEHSFGGQYFSEVTVSENNPIYDSRNDCNAIIETETNKLIIGSTNTTIPDDVKIIGSRAFEKSTIREVVLPDSIESIESDAFADCVNLETIKTSRYINNISDSSFNLYYYKNVNTHTVFYVYSNTPFHNFVLEKHRIYVLLDETPNPPKIINILCNGKREYLPFETLDISSYRCSVQYEGIDELEEITSFRNPRYVDGRDSLRYDDWDAWLYYDTLQGYHNVEMWIPVIVEQKLTPEYEIPVNVKANVNSTLADVELPEGFEWEDDTILLTEVGNTVKDARFIPEDSDNYSVVENIAVPIQVIDKTLIKPTITVQDKQYDGTTNLSLDNITISDLDENDYTIESVSLKSSNSGPTKALIKLKLTDEVFESYSFSNCKQEKTFVIDTNIIPLKFERPTMSNITYKYNGSYQYAIINDYIEDYMTIEGNRQKDAGDYEVKITLDKNCLWDIGTGFNFDIYLPFSIEKADIEYTSSNSEFTYDGNTHGIELNVPNNATVKYSNQDGDYILDSMPKYTEVGNYLIKYKIDIDDNYNTAYGENTLTINVNSNPSTGYKINNYLVDETNKYISKVMVGTTLNNYRSNFELSSGYTINVQLKNDVLYTGSKTKIYNNNVLEDEYTNVVIGDINGDGIINSSDLLRVRQHLLDINVLEEYKFLSSDINYDNNINSSDLLRMRQHLIGSKSISE